MIFITISQRIFLLLKEKKLKQKALAQKTGISESAISDWKKKGTNPAADNLSAIADFLGVSLSYLITGKEAPQTEKLSTDQQELIDYYNKLPEREQQRLIGRAAALVDIYNEEQINEPEIPIVILPHSYYKVSAGRGFDMDENNSWESIEVPATHEAEKADFCLTISGDSMEPVYYDGDIVLVKNQTSVDLGQIGIFSIEGAGYIKKYAGDRLISLNSIYPDIKFSDYDSESIRCYGLVIGRV